MPDINQVFGIILGVAVMLLLVWPVAGRPKHKRPKDERTLRQKLDVFATWFVRVVGALILIGLFALWASTVLDEKWKEYWPESYYKHQSFQVTAEPKPHGCDFWDAPIGNKHCAYVRQILRTEQARIVVITWERVNE